MIYIVPPTKGGNGPGPGPKCPHDCSILCSTLCKLFCKEVYYILPPISPELGR